ncbi:MAG TPA: hypothetical protein VGH28_16135 [Polyangiaceae bacterium]|jgi:hypothetical protein
MQGYPLIVRTGRPDLDVQTVEQHRRAAAAQGIVLVVAPLAGGGFELSAAAQAPGVGSTLPSNQRQAVRPSTPPPSGAPAQEAPLGDPSGTLPSRHQYARPSATPQVELILRPGEGYCESCRRVAALRHAHFTQNIGALILRFPRTVDGQLCKLCIDKFFFRFTATTMFLGWWGIISFFYSAVAIPANVINWTASFGMVAPVDDIDSFRERRMRGTVGVAVGALILALALLTLALGALVAWSGPGGESGGVTALVILGAAVGLVSTVILFFGIRTRVRATAGLRRLGALR